jgi:hypothetical protein
MAKFLKEGGGSLRLHGRIIKPGQVFTADPKDIPVAFRDTVIPQEAGFSWEKADVIVLPKVEAPVYKLKPAAREGWFDIVDVNGKKLTEKALKKEDALSLMADLGVNVSELKEEETEEDIETEKDTEEVEEEEEEVEEEEEEEVIEKPKPVKKTKKAKK